jgi:hypothetical protein
MLLSRHKEEKKAGRQEGKAGVVQRAAGSVPGMSE